MNTVAPAPAPVRLVLPGDVDDPAVPSGGNAYDRRVRSGLAAAGHPVHEIAVAGGWPHPDGAARAELARSLGALPDGTAVLLDGLVACGVPEIVVPEAARLSLAVLVHLPLADEPGSDPGLDERERRVLRAAGAVVATSPWAARRLTEHHGLDPARVHVAEPGTDPAPVAPGGGAGTRLLCVASVTPRKGHDLLVEALAAVAGRPWTCECAGPLSRDPAYAARLRELIGRHGLADRVRLTGPLAGQRLEAAYAAADLVVLPSHAETYGMVVAEALARGIPVLATAVGGVPDTLGRTPGGRAPGILVPPGDAAALAAALHLWLDDPGLRERLAAAARERRGTLPTWERTTRHLSAVLDRLPRRRPIRYDRLTGHMTCDPTDHPHEEPR